jgi:hypothetical protein
MNPNDVLAPYGLHASIEDGALVLRWKNGIECTYSGRTFTPVAFPGLGVDVEARLARPGEGEIKIDGQVLKFDGSESLLRMD